MNGISCLRAYYGGPIDNLCVLSHALGMKTTATKCSRTGKQLEPGDRIRVFYRGFPWETALLVLPDDDASLADAKLVGRDHLVPAIEIYEVA